MINSELRACTESSRSMTIENNKYKHMKFLIIAFLAVLSICLIEQSDVNAQSQNEKKAVEEFEL